MGLNLCEYSGPIFFKSAISHIFICVSTVDWTVSYNWPFDIIESGQIEDFFPPIKIWANCNYKYELFSKTDPISKKLCNVNIAFKSGLPVNPHIS